ncbi:MAG: hypothetical protein RL346_1706 [Verrucomicrobiota bacterium]
MKSRHLVFSRFGPPRAVLKLEPFESRELQDDHVLLAIQAAPINPADLNLIEGTYGTKPSLPATAGIEGFAKVLESRSGRFNPGDAVIPIKHIGTWADHAVAHEQDLIRIPREIDPLQAAMLRVNPATAHLLLTHFEALQPNAWVTLNAANSGVGQCVIQLARHHGIRTLCFLRNLALAPHLRALGATAVFTDSAAGLADATDFLGKERPGLAFNAVGGDSALRLMKLLATSGTLITYGAMARKPLTVPNRPLIFNDIRLRGLWVTQWIRQASHEAIQETYSGLADLVVAGKLHQAIDTTFDLAEFSQAFERIDAPERMGKILFAIGRDPNV